MSALISKFKKNYMFTVLVHFFPVVGDDVTCDVSKGSSRISVRGGKEGMGEPQIWGSQIGRLHRAHFMKITFIIASARKRAG